MTLLDGFAWTRQGCGTALQSAPLAEVADHFFTTRQLWLRGESERADWASVATAIGVSTNRLLRLNQVHGRGVVVHRAGPRAVYGENSGVLPGVGESESSWPQADILVTDDTTVALVVQAADCVPLLVADRRSGAVAAVYASHMLHVPFIPYGQKHPQHLGRLLIVDTARESGATLRKAERKYEGTSPLVIVSACWKRSSARR